MSRVVAAFDIGSGATKVVVARVLENAVIGEIFLAEEHEVLVKLDAEKNHNFLSSAIERQLHDTIISLRSRAEEFGAKKFSGICTAAFRDASNGSEVVRRLCNSTGVTLRIVSQNEEGKYGFLSARALCRAKQSELKQAKSAKVQSDGFSAFFEGKRELFSYDSGGASFQICAEDGACFEGPWGSVNTTALLMRKIQNRVLDNNSSANPATLAHYDQLKQMIRDSLRSIGSADLRNRIANSFVVAIGGPTCVFQMLKLAFPERDEFGVEDAETLAHSILGKRDDEIDSKFPQKQLLIGKMALFSAVMSELNIRSVNYIYCVGSCPAILVENHDDLKAKY